MPDSVDDDSPPSEVEVIDPWVLGHIGEEYIAGRLADLGIPIQPGGPADLIIHEDVPIEIKTARYRHYKRGRPGYQFCINRRGNGCQGSYLILLIWNNDDQSNLDAFIIPRTQLNGQNKITIPSSIDKYAGKYAKWLNQWSILRLE